MYLTPGSRRSTLFFFPSQTGRLFTDPLTGHSFHGLEGAASPQPGGWSAEVWVPAEQLSHFGQAWGEAGAWTLFCGRYNHTRGRDEPELSMMPPLSRSRYHLTGEYARIEFTGPLDL